MKCRSCNLKHRYTIVLESSPEENEWVAKTQCFSFQNNVMGSQSEPHLCLPWGLFTAGKGNPNETYFHKGEWEEYTGGENLMSSLHELNQRQCACIHGGSGYSSHCQSDSPEVLYIASESDLWSGAVIRKQIQVRWMGHVKCKVPATLKPASWGIIWSRCAWGQFHQPQAGTSRYHHPWWKALTSKAQKPYCCRDKDWERNEAKATQLQTGKFLEDRRWTAFLGFSEPCGRLWGYLEAGVSPHSTPTLPLTPAMRLSFSVFLCSIAFCTDSHPVSPRWYGLGSKTANEVG